MDERLEAARKLGVRYTVNSGRGYGGQGFSEYTGGRMAELVMECSGAMPLSAPPWTLLPTQAASPSPDGPRRKLLRQPMPSPARRWTSARPHQRRRVRGGDRLIYTGKVDVRKILTKVVTMDETPETIIDIEKNPGNYMKVVVKMD